MSSFLSKSEKKNTKKKGEKKRGTKKERGKERTKKKSKKGRKQTNHQHRHILSIADRIDLLAKAPRLWCDLLRFGFPGRRRLTKTMATEGNADDAKGVPREEDDDAKVAHPPTASSSAAAAAASKSFSKLFLLAFVGLSLAIGLRDDAIGDDLVAKSDPLGVGTDARSMGDKIHISFCQS
jgi:hypothetical protein